MDFASFANGYVYFFSVEEGSSGIGVVSFGC